MGLDVLYIFQYNGRTITYKLFLTFMVAAIYNISLNNIPTYTGKHSAFKENTIVMVQIKSQISVWYTFMTYNKHEYALYKRIDKAYHQP